MTQMEENSSAANGVPAPEHGKMPKWLFFAWVIFLVWGLIYLAKYVVPDLKEWADRPLPMEPERPK